jgi:hypothetical protein
MSDEPKNPEEMTADELKAAMLAPPETPEAPPAPETPETPEVPETPAPPELETYTAADGTVYSAKTKDELFAKVTGALAHTKEALKDRERQIHELKPPKEEPKEEYSNAKWMELAETDVRAANAYAAKFDPDFQQLRQVVQQTEQQRQLSNAILKFHADVPDYAKVETPEVTAAFTARLKETGRQVTADNLKLTYFELKEAGTIPAAPAPVTRKKAPPRSPDGGGGPTTPTIDPENMSKEDIRKYLNEHAVH